jgi:arylsulfatase A-like enzyme/Flp pilus assembly protein TadD
MLAVAQNLPHPDIFLLTIDTLRADHVHCYGYHRIRTPAIDRLAADGVRFSEAFTASPITNTSHISILTGLLPATHGVSDFGIPLTSANRTWAEILKQNGYQTAAFIGAIILDSRILAPGLDRGFDFYDNFLARPRNTSRWGRLERRGMDVVQRAEAWLTAHPQGNHFVWIHLYDPHDPYEPPPPFAKIYRGHLYDGEIAYADSAIANFIDYLKKRRWYEKSLVIVVADHGEGLEEHGEKTHGVFLYDSTMHVPLIFKMPGLVPASVAEGQVRTIDILPTVLDLLDIRSREQLDGESLKPYLDETNPAMTKLAGRTVFAETEYPVRFGWAPLRAVRAEGFKFIEAPRPELYDLSTDPGEIRNRYEPWNPMVQRLRDLLLRRSGKIAASAPGESSLSSSTLAELRALGYLGPLSEDQTVTALTPSLLADPKDHIEEQNLLHTAMIAVERNRAWDARRALERLLAGNPESGTALLQLGELELRASRYEKAAEYLRRARKARPSDAIAAFDEGQVLAKLGYLSGAREALKTSLALAPKQFASRLLLGQVYMELKDFKDAEEQFEAALSLEPDSFQARLETAKAQIANGSVETATVQLNVLAEMRPNSIEVFELLSQANRMLGRRKEARLAERRAKSLRTPKTKP